jgi:hypothetical protein
MLWDWDGALERILHALHDATRAEGWEVNPTAAIIHSQSAKAARKRDHDQAQMY